MTTRVTARTDAAVELAGIKLAIAAHRHAIDRYIVLDWPDKEALERERLREALQKQAARWVAMTEHG